MKQMTMTTGKAEWYTPARYIEAARAVLGSIDLDPASCEQAQATVKATRYFTAADDGLRQKWGGRVFMNPPYGKQIIDDFVGKLLRFYERGLVGSYIALTNDCMDTQWSHDLLRASSAVCFVRGRIKFETPEGEAGQRPPRGQMFCYGGDDVAAFERNFAQFGIVIRL